MAVLHDWECMAHGRFESTEKKCPWGCGEGLVKKVFLKAPAYHNGSTQNIDKTLNDLASDYNLTDMNNQNGTGAVSKEDWQARQQREEMQQAMMKGQTQAVALSNKDGAIAGALSNLGVSGDNALSRVQQSLEKPKPIVHASWNGKD